MASVVIVSDQCYLLAEAINYIVINEVDDTDDNQWQPTTTRQRKLRNRNPSKYQHLYAMERKPYNIIIDFIPKGGPNIGNGGMGTLKKSNGDNTSVSIRVHGLNRTMKLFRSIVDQIREQIPDEQFLNKLVEQFLTDEEET